MPLFSKECMWRKNIAVNILYHIASQNTLWWYSTTGFKKSHPCYHIYATLLNTQASWINYESILWHLILCFVVMTNLIVSYYREVVQSKRPLCLSQKQTYPFLVLCQNYELSNGSGALLKSWNTGNVVCGNWRRWFPLLPILLLAVESCHYLKGTSEKKMVRIFCYKTINVSHSNKKTSEWLRRQSTCILGTSWFTQKHKNNMMKD